MSLNASGIVSRLAVAVFAALVVISAFPQSSVAQAPQPVFTYVTLWGVPRAQWSEIGKITADQKAMLDPMVANGTVLGYGFFENRVHSEDGFTHGTWIQADSIANVFKALEPAYANPDVTAPVLAASKHHDLFLIANSHRATAISDSTGYLRVISAQIQPGKLAEFMNAYRQFVVPVYDKLMMDGAIASYELDMEYNIENAPGRVFFAATSRDAEGLDQTRAALNDLFEKNPAALQSLVSPFVPDSRSDTLARITSMTHR